MRGLKWEFESEQSPVLAVNMNVNEMLGASFQFCLWTTTNENTINMELDNIMLEDDDEKE